MNTVYSPVHARPAAEPEPREIVTVSVPPPDAHLSFTERLSLRLGLWLLLRTQHPRWEARRRARIARRVRLIRVDEQRAALETSYYEHARRLR